MDKKQKWLTLSLINLAIVALLGFVLRCKILFTIPFIDFKNTLHAHSHFAFGGWISLALIVLLVYEILPKPLANKKFYQAIFYSAAISSFGMLVMFLAQGYGLFSILFSNLFIITSYVFAFVFIKDVRRSATSSTVRFLAIASVLYLVISSIGPYTLAYLMASKSGNAILYKDAIYTYLHLQYNGFFTLAVLALLFNRIDNLVSSKGSRMMSRFASVLNLSVLPSLFLCYLWHYPNNLFRIIAVVGSMSLLLSSVVFLTIYISEYRSFRRISKTTYHLINISLAAFIIKMLLQSLTIFEDIGQAVFSNRPVIIGFLHLVFLGFVSLYILGHYIHAGILKKNRFTLSAVLIFLGAISLNEMALMVQGLEIMFMHNSQIFAWLLLVAAIGLFTGSIALLIARFRSKKMVRAIPNTPVQPQERKILFIKHK